MKELWSKVKWYLVLVVAGAVLTGIAIVIYWRRKNESDVISDQYINRSWDFILSKHRGEISEIIAANRAAAARIQRTEERLLKSGERVRAINERVEKRDRRIAGIYSEIGDLLGGLQNE